MYGESVLGVSECGVSWESECAECLGKVCVGVSVCQSLCVE